MPGFPVRPGPVRCSFQFGRTSMWRPRDAALGAHDLASERRHFGIGRRVRHVDQSNSFLVAVARCVTAPTALVVKEIHATVRPTNSVSCPISIAIIKAIPRIHVVRRVIPVVRRVTPIVWRIVPVVRRVIPVVRRVTPIVWRIVLRRVIPVVGPKRIALSNDKTRTRNQCHHDPPCHAHNPLPIEARI